MSDAEIGCACYDGPISSADPSLVSIRCLDHQDRPPLKGHRWIRRDPILGNLRMNEWYDNRRRYAIPKKRRAIVQMPTQDEYPAVDTYPGNTAYPGIHTIVVTTAEGGFFDRPVPQNVAFDQPDPE